MTKRPVKRGEELTDCYGIHFATEPRDERRKKLKKWFKFNCQCTACAANVPLLKEMTMSMTSQTESELQKILREFKQLIQDDGFKRESVVKIQDYFRTISSVECSSYPTSRASETGGLALSLALWNCFGNPNC